MKLAGAEKYQPEKLEQLEKYVEEQVSSSTYSLDANLALLRFYQFQPNSIKVNVLAKVLLKALMQLPNPDFKACIHLVPERVQGDDTISKIIQLASALETTRFQDFWLQTASLRDLLNTIPGFYEAVRGFALHVLGITFQRVPKKVLAEYLKLEGATLDSMVSQRVSNTGWSVQSTPGGDIIMLPKNDLNQLVIARTQEIIRFDQVAPVLHVLSVGF